MDNVRGVSEMEEDIDSIGSCKKCSNLDYLNEEKLCTECSKYEPDLRCCGVPLNIYENTIIDVPSVGKKILFRQRTLKARCVVCGNDYLILFGEKSKRK